MSTHIYINTEISVRQIIGHVCHEGQNCLVIFYPSPRLSSSVKITKFINIQKIQVLVEIITDMELVIFISVNTTHRFSQPLEPANLIIV